MVEESVTRLKVMRSLQKKPLRMDAAAALNELWPDQCSGDDPGLPARGDHLGSAAVLSFPSVWASRIAVMGRQKW